MSIWLNIIWDLALTIVGAWYFGVVFTRLSTWSTTRRAALHVLRAVNSIGNDLVPQNAIDLIIKHSCDLLLSGHKDAALVLSRIHKELQEAPPTVANIARWQEEARAIRPNYWRLFNPLLDSERI